MNREAEPDPEVLRDKTDEMTNLMIRYTEVTQGKTYTESHYDRCCDFIDDFYYVLEKPSRDAEMLEPFFAEQCKLNVVGVGNVTGRELALKAILVSLVHITNVKCYLGHSHIICTRSVFVVDTTHYLLHSGGLTTFCLNIY